MKWYLHVLKNYATFSGRASRTEYWMFILINFIFGIILWSVPVLTGVMSLSFLVLLYNGAVFLPSMALLVRRLHDTSRSGYFAFLVLIPLVGAIVLLVFMCQRGTDGDNSYGTDPLRQHDVN